MRNLQNNISSIIGNIIASRGIKLNVRAEVLRSLCADLSAALSYFASRLSIEMSDVVRRWPVGLAGLKPRVPMACCFVLVKQHQRGHEATCHHPVA